MKPWEEYQYNNDPYPSFQAIKRELLDEIDNTPMTKAQREEAGKAAVQKARDRCEEILAPIRKAEKELQATFWKDCREDLGYDKLMSADAVKVFEAFAEEEGHSNGFESIHNWLDRLTDLFKAITKKA